MHRSHYTLPFLLALSWHALADPPHLQQGIWPGSFKLSGQDEARARIHVSNEPGDGDSVRTRIIMYVDEIPLEFVNLEIRKSGLQFKIDTGTLNECTLARKQNGTYTGFCKVPGEGDQGNRIELTMRPPSADGDSETTGTQIPAVKTEGGE